MGHATSRASLLAPRGRGRGEALTATMGVPLGRESRIHSRVEGGARSLQSVGP